MAQIRSSARTMTARAVAASSVKARGEVPEDVPRRHDPDGHATIDDRNVAEPADGHLVDRHRVGIAVLAGSRSQSMNMRAAFLEVVNDALGSVAVLVAAVCIATLGWTRADAVASLAIGLLILPRTWLLLRETVDVLLESTPRGLDLDALRARLLAMDHVRGVHDLHATQVAANLPVLTAHVVVEDLCFHDAHLPALLDEMQRCLADEYDVEHSTFQFEREVHAEHEHSTHP